MKTTTKSEYQRRGILWAVPIEPIGVAPRFPVTPNESHVTFKFDVLKRAWVEWVNVEFEAEIIGNHWNDRVQALSVRLPDDLTDLCDNAIPHLTVSWVEGAAPVESNEMLAQPHSSDRFVQNVRFQMQFYDFR